jgi:hypothetical protein
MKVPVFILAGLLTCVLAVQGWTLNAIVDLKIKVAELAATVAAKKS